MATSTTYSEGMHANKPSSKVLKPPGGGSSNIFGGYEDSGSAQQRREVGDNNKSRMQTSNVFGAPTESPKPPAKPENGEDDPDKKEEEEESQEEQTVKPATPARAPNPITGEFAENGKSKQSGNRVGVNPITGEQYAENKKNPVHTSTKVRMPPGGASSGIW